MERQARQLKEQGLALRKEVLPQTQRKFALLVIICNSLVITSNFRAFGELPRISFEYLTGYTLKHLT